MTPVNHTPPLRKTIAVSPFQLWKTIKGNVWMSASTNMAQLIQPCQTLSFSGGTPVSADTMFALAPSASMKGVQARASQPVRVAMGGEPP